MNKRVSVRITGLHSFAEEDDQDNIEVINFGSYYKKNGKHYVKYEEPLDKTGMGTSNILKVSEGEVELISKGAANTHMMFCLGKKNINFYATPFGGMNVGVDTYEMHIEETEDRLAVSLKYGLEINLDYVATCNVNIVVESAGEE